ncbi:glycosyltransferase family 4 protein [Pseudoscourfieldia marina]
MCCYGGCRTRCAIRYMSLTVLGICTAISAIFTSKQQLERKTSSVDARGLGCTNIVRDDVFKFIRSYEGITKEYAGYRKIRVCRQEVFSDDRYAGGFAKDNPLLLQYDRILRQKHKNFGFIDFSPVDRVHNTVNRGYMTFPSPPFAVFKQPESKSTRIFLVTQIPAQGFRAQMLSAWVEHYSRLGVSKRNMLFTIRVNTATSAVQVSSLINFLGSHEIYFDVYIGDWTSEALMFHQLHKLKFFTKARDWIVTADSDEFHEYPGGNVESFLKYCEKAGYNLVNGLFLDRVARNGHLKKLDDNISLFDQFPLGCRLHNLIALGTPKKVMAYKGTLRINRGHHRVAPCTFWERRKLSDLTNWPMCDPWRIESLNPYPKILNVHHFKWMQGQLESIRMKMAHYVRGDSSYRAYANSLKHMEYYNGICVHCKRTMCRSVADFEYAKLGIESSTSTSGICNLQLNTFIAGMRRDERFSACADIPHVIRRRLEKDSIVVFDIGAKKGYWSAELIASLTNSPLLSTRFLFNFWKDKLVANPCGSCEDCQENWRRANITISRARFIMVEASPSTFSGLTELMQRRVSTSVNLEIYNMAMSSTSGKVLFIDAGVGREKNQISNGNTKENRARHIQSSTLDDLCKKVNVKKIDLLKIDVEGHDPIVIYSGESCLQNVETVVFEYHGIGAWQTHSLKDLVKWLSKRHFRCYYLGRNDVLVEISECWQDAFERKEWSNVMCTKANIW